MGTAGQPDHSAHRGRGRRCPYPRQRLVTDPIILPSLLANRGFTAGLLVGLAYFATVNGLAYVLSLFLQNALGLSASRAALGLSPLMAGIIISSFVGRP